MMNILIEARNVADQKRRNKILTLLVMGGFAGLLALLGYGFDYAMAAFRNFQLITIPVAIVIVASMVFNFVDGLNERFFGTDSTEKDEYYTNKITLWMVSASFLIVFWIVYTELSYLDPHTFGRLKPLLVLRDTFPYGTLAGVFLGSVTAFSALQWGAYAVLRSAECQPADPSFENDALLLKTVEEVSTAAKIPLPAVLIVPDDVPNAFAVGRSPKHASLVVSQGLMEDLTPNELRGVIAHEISHIRSYDIRLRTTVTALFGSVVVLSQGAERISRKSLGVSMGFVGVNAVKKILLLVFWLISLLIVPIAVFALVVLTFRRREYLADASAGELSGDPDALASALRKLDQAAGSSATLKRNVAHLCIIDPLARSFNASEGWFADILATHPPTSKRILMLESLAPTMRTS
jgi:heat shock protein HtpX